MTGRPPEEWTREEWAELQADLDRLEVEDPAVREAAAAYDRMVTNILARRGDREDQP